MSYDLSLLDPVTREVLTIDSPHHIRGGTYRVGGTNELCLNITYNYCRHYYGEDRLGLDGLYGFDGVPAVETIPLISRTIEKLGDDVSDNYWESTEGTAKKALHGLLALAKMRPDGVWQVT